MGRVTRITLKLGTESNEIKSDLFYVFSYLGLVESLGNSIVDLLVLLLVANGRDFHIECLRTTPRIKHALTIEDLEKEKVPLTTKLNFMRDNNLRFIASLIDTDLRNTIAHLKFETRDGKIYVKSKTGKSMRQLTRKELNYLLSKMLRGLLKAAGLIDFIMKEKGAKTS
jgi:virulence-associated protein VapD